MPKGGVKGTPRAFLEQIASDNRQAGQEEMLAPVRSPASPRSPVALLAPPLNHQQVQPSDFNILQETKEANTIDRGLDDEGDSSSRNTIRQLDDGRGREQILGNTRGSA